MCQALDPNCEFHWLISGHINVVARIDDFYTEHTGKFKDFSVGIGSQFALRRDGFWVFKESKHP